MMSALTEHHGAPGQITSIAWIYAIFGAGLVIACFAGAQTGQVRLSSTDAVFPAVLILAAIGAIRRKSWGRWLCYGFSVLIFPFVPLGTIVGGLMIYHLTVHRDQFGRSSQNLSNNG
jgi:hypothetical protein